VHAPSEAITGWRATRGWRQGARLLLSAAALLAAVTASDALIGAAVSRAPGWGGTGDPRERILWDDGGRDAPVVLIGDSVFCSYFVNRPEDTLWARLAERLRVPVFPAALNGATTTDLALIGRRVAAEWLPGTVALVDVHASRIFRPGARGALEANYAAELGSLEARGGAAALVGVPAPGPFLRRHSFLYRNHGRLQEFMAGTLKPAAEYYGQGKFRDRRWDAGDGFALARFRELEQGLAGEQLPRLVTDVDWLLSLERTLRDARLRPVIVLTPLNHALLKEYAKPGSVLPGTLASSRAYLLERLAKAGVEYVDLYSSPLDPASFADLLHPNARGEAAVAAILAREIAPRLGTRPGAKR